VHQPGSQPIVREFLDRVDVAFERFVDLAGGGGVENQLAKIEE
jgi:hypothetical protein